MSKPPSRPQLYTPRISRVPTPRMDSDAVGKFTESIARFFGTGSYLLIQTIVVIVWIVLNIVAVSSALGPLSVHPAQPGVFHPGRLRGAADPAGPEPAGEP